MAQDRLVTAALTVAVRLVRRFGALLPTGGRRGEYTLADLVEHPAILLVMRCWGGERRSLEPLLETFVSQDRSGAPPIGWLERAPDFFQ